jgi:hypothetical protein
MTWLLPKVIPAVLALVIAIWIVVRGLSKRRT